MYSISRLLLRRKMLEKLILGKFEEERNGVPIKYRIETVSPEQEEQVIDHMKNYFLKREPLTTYDGFLHDQPSLNSIVKIWKEAIKAGTAMVALLEETDDDKVKVIGTNITLIVEKDKKDEDSEGEAFKKVVKVVNIITDRANIYERYGIDKYLSAFGLSVHSDYHGYNVGYNLLSSREPLCKVLGLNATGTVFSNPAAQHVAAKVGFEVLSEESYDTFEVDGKVAYLGLKGVLNHMGKKYSF